MTGILWARGGLCAPKFKYTSATPWCIFKKCPSPSQIYWVSMKQTRGCDVYKAPWVILFYPGPLANKDNLRERLKNNW